MKISNHFTLREAEHSDTATKKGIDNVLSPSALENARYTASRLDYIRLTVGLAFTVNSWYRSEKLNTAVGGSTTSQHLRGLAVDFYTKSNNRKVFEQITQLQKAGKISFDQCYYKPASNFIHISFCRNMEDERNMSWIKE